MPDKIADPNPILTADHGHRRNVVGGQAIFEAGVVLVRELAGNSDRRVAGVQRLQWDAVVRRDHVTRESQEMLLPEVVLMSP